MAFFWFRPLLLTRELIQVKGKKDIRTVLQLLGQQDAPSIGEVEEVVDGHKCGGYVYNPSCVVAVLISNSFKTSNEALPNLSFMMLLVFFQIVSFLEASRNS